MVDVNSVLDRLEALKAYLTELDYYAQYSLHELTTDFVKYRAAQHSLQLAAQVVVDIATHIVSADFHARVQDYREASESLDREGVLSAEFAHRLAPLAGFRNLLVHAYLTVDPAQLYKNLIQGCADLREFSQQIIAYLQRTGALEVVQ